MRVCTTRRRSASSAQIAAGPLRTGRVLKFSLVLALALLAQPIGVGAQTVTNTATSTSGPGLANVDPLLLNAIAASSTQMLPIIVEARPMPATAAAAAPTPTTTTSTAAATTASAPPASTSPPPATPPVAGQNQLLAQHALALLQQFGQPVGALALINSAAGWANAAGIFSISLDPQVAYIYADVNVHPSTGTPAWQIPLSAAFPRAVNADRTWWQQSATGAGTSIAVLDSGINTDPDLTQPNNRILATANFADARGPMLDPGGHGTHVAGIAAGNGYASSGEYVGIAPGANLIDVRVLDSNGNGRLSSVIRGIEFVLAHRTQYNIRLINLSLGAPPSPSYKLSPLDAACEIAWMRGVAVVAAAGNNGSGSTSGNVDSPGDDPYVITVGATDDQGTAGTADDVLAWFSSWGTPLGSTSKPDVVAPGRKIVSLRVPGSYLDLHYPDRVMQARTGATYFRLSGTSMATPVMTGAAALMLQVQPGLSPDQIKAIAMSSTQAYGWASGGPAVPAPGADGSGLIDTLAEAWAAPQASTSASGTSPFAAPLNAIDPLRRRLARPVKQAYRPANTLLRAMYPAFYGVAPLVWKDPAYQGQPWSSYTWSNLAWDNLAWDNLAWDNLAWDNLAWDNLAWDNLAWDNLAWDNLAWDNLAWDTNEKQY